jgi:hypothetical protein
VFVGGVVGYQVHDDFQPALVSFLQHGIEGLKRPEERVHLAVVGHVISPVSLRGFVERGEPNGVHSQLLQVGQAFRNAA